MAGGFLVNRYGVWHYNRRVPLNVSPYDKRTFARQTTKIRVADDPRGIKAGKIAERINAETEAFWLMSLKGNPAEAQAHYDAARAQARGFGFDYLTADQFKTLSPLERVQRLEAARDAPQSHEPAAVASVLGGVPVPRLMLSDLLDKFEHINRAGLMDLSPDQMRKWRNPKRRAVENFISVIGDRPLTEVTRSEALDFRAWWETRVIAGEVEIETANKDFGHLNSMFKAVERTLRIGLGPVFAEMRITGGTTGQRVAFAPAFIQDRLLADGVLDNLNPEARRVLFLIVETGLRLSEACNLTSETIRLNATVPHVEVRADGRRMKTEQSARMMPLVGVSLMAAQAQPEGFPRYRDKAATLSASVNKFMTENGLLPVEGQSLYSLRHSFEDRLTAVEAPDKLAAALMGHKFHRPRYGLGPSLEQKREWVQRIAFKPPSMV
jgi:integrase